MASDDWEQGRISNEFYDKTYRRGIADKNIERALRSRSCGVWRYRQGAGRERYGIWHPELGLFVVWQPVGGDTESHIKTAFWEDDALGYASRLEDVEVLRLPRG